MHFVRSVNFTCAKLCFVRYTLDMHEWQPCFYFFRMRMFQILLQGKTNQIVYCSLSDPPKGGWGFLMSSPVWNIRAVI